jgi:hypothetical protein
MQNECFSIYLNGATAPNIFHWKPSLRFTPKYCIVRQILYNTLQLNDTKVYNIWSTLNNGWFGTFSGSKASAASYLFATNSVPQTLIKISNMPAEICFQIMTPDTNSPLLIDGLIPTQIGAVNTHSSARLTIHVDFFTLKDDNIQAVHNECVSWYNTAAAGTPRNFQFQTTCPFKPDLGIVRSVVCNDLRFLNFITGRHYYLWSDMTNEVICQYAGHTSFEAQKSEAFISNPQTVFIPTSQPYDNIRFQLYTQSLTNATQNDNLPELIPCPDLVLQGGVDSVQTSIMYDFIKFREKN